MFIAMNRFRVKAGSEAEFERIWAERETNLPGMTGFVSFHLLKGPAAEGQVLYASHTTWESRADFEAWVNSDAFRASHSRAGGSRDMYLAPPQFEGFEVVQTVR
jgi:heme-degrading monooxygenase HmoA